VGQNLGKKVAKITLRGSSSATTTRRPRRGPGQKGREKTRSFYFLLQKKGAAIINGLFRERVGTEARIEESESNKRRCMASVESHFGSDEQEET